MIGIQEIILLIFLLVLAWFLIRELLRQQQQQQVVVHDEAQMKRYALNLTGRMIWIINSGYHGYKFGAEG